MTKMKSKMMHLPYISKLIQSYE